MSKKNNREIDSIVFENQKIVDVGIEKEVRKSFIEYAMSVIIARALPDVRDGMKPGQRRIIYTMYEDHLTQDRPYCKSATTVGAVLGRYHPHGDSSVYGSMVRMAQDFNMRYTLIDGKGNFGSVDGDPPAAYRYTEARLEKIANELTRDLDKDVVNMIPNFDNRLREPEVLPSRFPNLLVNGSMGIAVGMATNIPTHNLGEVIDATVYRMDHPECSIFDLMQFIKGPDFPTAATIYGTNGIKEAYLTGKGRVNVRAKAEVEEDKRRIIVTEIPYGVNKSMLCAAIADLVKDKRIEGITGIRDESGRNGMRIVIEYKREANGQIILNQLYKYSQLQDTCAINMLAIVNNEPKTMNLAQILDYYIAHQESVIVRRTQFDLNAALHDAHIYEGYKLAIDNIDEVINIIRSSPDQPTAKINLMKRFDGTATDDGSAGALNLEAFAAEENPSLSEEQAQAIVSMTLGRLSGLERKKIEDKLAQLEAAITEYRAILADMNKVKEIIKNEMLEIKEKFGDARRTRIEEAEDDIVLEDLIEKHNCVITMTHAGYIKRQPASVYTAQGRGGKGVIGMATKEEDYIEKVLSVHSHSTCLLFTNTGRVQAMRAFQIPEAGRTAKGSNLVNLMQLEPEEKVTSMIAVNGFSDDRYLTMVTRNGVIKRTLLSDYAYQRKGGKIALALDEGDELVFVTCTGKEPVDLIIATHNGCAVRFTVDDESVRPMGRTARGVRGISLRDDDYVVGVTQVTEGKMLITITENGMGKRTAFDDFRQMRPRGGFGVTCHNLSEKTGKLAGINAVAEGDDLLMITDSGTVIRTNAGSIPVYSRSASGVIVMRLQPGQKVANFTCITYEQMEEDRKDYGDEDVQDEEPDAGNEEGDTDAILLTDEELEGLAPADEENTDASEEEPDNVPDPEQE